MDTKLILLFALIATLCACVLSENIDRALRDDIKEEQERVLIVKRSIDEAAREAAFAADEANIVHSRHKRGVFAGSYPIMGVACAVGGIVILAGIGYCIFMLTFHKQKLGTGVGEETL